MIVARNILLAELLDSPIHCQHISSGGSVRLIREARSRGVKISGEVCPHHIALTDAERTTLQDACLAHVGARVPVIVTCSHFSTRIAADRPRRAAAAGAAMAMLMPPYHGAGLRADESGVYEHFARVVKLKLGQEVGVLVHLRIVDAAHERRLALSSLIKAVKQRADLIGR